SRPPCKRCRLWYTKGSLPVIQKRWGSVWINSARSMRGYAAGRCKMRCLSRHRCWSWVEPTTHCFFIRSRLRQQPRAPFKNYKGEAISERGIRKLVVKYREKAGITKRASCHTLRHTFATYKAEKGVSPFQLQQWLGHANLNTTQIYVHLGKQNAKKLMEQTSLA